jgi:hypothetical protein
MFPGRPDRAGGSAVQELQVPTRTVEVECVTVAGQRLRGALFVPVSPQRQDDLHDVIELLNDERLFVPFRSADSTFGPSLINKRQVLRVRLAGLPPEEGPDAGGEQDCTLVLLDGSRLQGRVILAKPPCSARVLDKLNDVHDFVPFVSADGHELVQRRHVVRVY